MTTEVRSDIARLARTNFSLPGREMNSQVRRRRWVRTDVVFRYGPRASDLGRISYSPSVTPDPGSDLRYTEVELVTLSSAGPVA
jgi:hypothetical protein